MYCLSPKRGQLRHSARNGKRASQDRGHWDTVGTLSGHCRDTVGTPYDDANCFTQAAGTCARILYYRYHKPIIIDHRWPNIDQNWLLMICNCTSLDIVYIISVSYCIIITLKSDEVSLNLATWQRRADVVKLLKAWRQSDIVRQPMVSQCLPWPHNDNDKSGTGGSVEPVWPWNASMPLCSRPARAC